MATNSIGAYNINADTFMRLFITQVQNQDIDNPTDTTAMISQLADLTGVQKLTEISERFTDAIAVANRGLANDMVGRVIAWVDKEGATNYGTVTSAGKSNGVIGVYVSDTFVPLSDVGEVTTADMLAALGS